MKNSKLFFLLTFLIPAMAEAMEEQSGVSLGWLDKAPQELKRRIIGYLDTNPLALAANVGDAESVAFILDNIKDKNALNSMLSEPAPGLGIALILAAKRGHAAIVGRLIDAGAKIEVKDDTFWEDSLRYSVVQGYLQVVEIILGQGVFTKQHIDEAIDLAESSQRAESRKRIVEERKIKTPEELEESMNFVAKMDSIIKILKEYEKGKKKIL